MLLKYGKQILIAIAFLIVLPIYFFFFFQSGIIINDKFLPQRVEGNATRYSGGGMSVLAAIIMIISLI